MRESSHLKDAFVECILCPVPCVHFEWKTAKSLAWSEWVHQTERVVFICLFSRSFLPSVSPDVFFHSHNASDLSVKKRQHDSTVCTSSSWAISSCAARHACNESPGVSNGGFDSVCF